jgi:type II secretory pathway component PulF
MVNMNQELFDILSHSNKDIDNQKLMDYLSGKLSEQEKFEVEKLMVGNDFFQDAVEGLENLKDSGKLQSHLDQLKRELQLQLKQNKSKRKRGRIQEYPWIYFTIVLILIIAIVGFLLIRQFLQ